MLPLPPCHPWLRQGMSLKHQPATAVVPAQSADGPVLAPATGTDHKRQARRGTCQANPGHATDRHRPVRHLPYAWLLTSRRPAPSPGTGQHHNHAGASDSACHGADDEAPGRSPAESYFRAPQGQSHFLMATDSFHGAGYALASVTDSSFAVASLRNSVARPKVSPMA
jgi:hypothetical protein